MPLTNLPVKRSGVIKSIENQGLIRRRLLDLGFVPGTRIQTVRKSPSGNPIAYLIRGTVIALRKEETDLIMVDID
ncbi:MAG: ferrous iron transport protein A [Syntrophomonadaceae bacterium]|nr:ferrous iron transport protein A [Syntrophomonadaceae bacterium]